MSPEFEKELVTVLKDISLTLRKIGLICSTQADMFSSTDTAFTADFTHTHKQLSRQWGFSKDEIELILDCCGLMTTDGVYSASNDSK